MRVSIESRVVIIYVIRLCHYTKSVSKKQIFRFRTFVRQSYFLYYSSNDQNFIYRLHWVQT